MSLHAFFQPRNKDTRLAALPALAMPACTVVLACFLAFFGPCPALAGDTSFSHFAVTLPQGWDGEEKTGFVSDNPDEYMLVLLRKDDAGENILAQATIYILPNTNGENARELAAKLAEKQADTTEPVQEGCFWTFGGEPRSTAIQGRALNRVSTCAGRMMIIIAQDSSKAQDLQPGQSAINVIDSLRGLTPMASELLCGKK